MIREPKVRFCILFGMAVFVVGIFVWGICNIQQTTHAQTKQTAKPDVKDDEKKDSAAKKETTAANIDIDALAQDLLNNVKYETTLSKIDDSVAQGMVACQQDSVMQLYMGDGTSSDELLVVTASGDEMAEKDQAAVEQHLKEMKQSFQDYIPEQAAKIEQAVIVRCGKYVVACVTSDADNAKEKIVKAFQ